VVVVAVMESSVEPVRLSASPQLQRDAEPQRPARREHPLLEAQRVYGNRAVRRALGAEGGVLSPALEWRIDRARGGGQGLAHDVRLRMERGLDADFSAVRMHADAEADSLNRAVNAHAFTVGNDVFFRHGAFDPGSSAGRELLAHELAHVVQQDGGGRVHAKLEVGSANDRLEQEAERAARSFVERETAEAQGDREEEETTATDAPEIRVGRQEEREELEEAP